MNIKEKYSPEPPPPKGEPDSAEMFEVSAEEKKRVLRARAKRLAQEPEIIEAAENCIEALAFLLAKETYAVETTLIREVYPLTELTPVPCTPKHICGIINIRGQILSIIDMKKFFHLPEKGITNLNRIVVVRNEAMELGILADEIIGIQDIPESGLRPPLSTMTGIDAEYIQGITAEGLILINMERFLGDKQLIVHEEVT